MLIVRGSLMALLIRQPLEGYRCAAYHPAFQIDGAVLVLIDIDDLKRSNAQLMEARDYADAIVETVWEPLIVLNGDLCVITANRSFYDTFQVSPVQTEQQLIFELGNGQWNIPQLRSLLEEILASNTQFHDFEVEHIFSTFLLS